MPKSDTWPGGAAMDSERNMDSAGSYDSVISVNSACSDDSMDHLSAEERACLMFLEEMIDSMEVQEDSGLSNEEPELLIQRDRRPDTSRLISNSKRAGKVESCLIRSENKCDHQIPSGASALTRSSAPETSVVDSPTDAGVATSRPALSDEMNLALIPPPSDFMDVPKASLLPESVSTFSPEKSSESVEQQQRRATEKTSHEKLTLPAETPGPSVVSPPAVDLVEPRTPPAVAPKPKKLPANIILKSHKFSGSDNNLSYSPPAGSDRNMLDPQKVHTEALRKLGLLKSDEKEPSPLLSPNHFPKNRNSWAAPSSPAPHRGPHAQINSPPQINLTVSPPTSSRDLDVLPAPAAFCDPKPELSPSSLTPPGVHLTPPRGVKSATLERSGPGLTCISEPRPGDLRNTRPRPASLGSRNEFLNVQGPGSQAGKVTSKQTDARRSFPAQGAPQKLPRSQGISVLISPRAENEEDRREALRKLGLLRD